MKKTALAALLAAAFASPGFAADMYVKAPAAVRSAAVNWTGCYLGVQGGATFLDTRGVYRDAGPIGTEINHFTPSGGLVGGTAGCNYQAGTWVYGIEGDWAWTNAKGSGPESAAPAFTFGVKENWFSTARGRVGFTTNNWLWYATGGVAFANFEVSDANAAGTTVTQNATHVGWTAGLGAEVQFAQNWSLKLEGLYMNLGRKNYFSPTTPIAGATFEVDAKQWVSRIGLNYRF